MTKVNINPTTGSKVQHLYQRAGFGLSPQEWQLRKGWPLDRALQDLFFPGQQSIALAVPPPPNGGQRFSKMDKMKRAEALREQRQLVAGQNTDWIKRMADTAYSPLLERMSLFWHGHFACESKIGKLVGQQLNSIREHALGSFRDLVSAIAKDPAMIRYLNNQQNRKGQPNENFARELMELFTLGRGLYSEQDIKEAARAFTGWSSNFQGAYVFRSRQHDYGDKTFMRRSGQLGGEDVIDIILEKPQTAYFITCKIYSYFVNEQVNEERVKALAQQFYQSGYDIGALMRSVFSSDWFYEGENQGNKVKSPVELMAGMMRQLHIQQIDTRGLIGLQRALGQVLFRPPNVAGWPGGRSWVDNSTLMMRLQLPKALYKASEIDFRFKDEPEQQAPRQLRRLEAVIDWDPMYKLVAGKSEAATFEELSAYLLATPPSVGWDELRPFVDRSNREAFVQTLCIRLMSLLEYQLC